MKHTKLVKEIPFPLLMEGFSRIIELDEGLWEITDDKGESVYATHCQLSSCGQPMFSKRLRVFYVCRDCVAAHSKERSRRVETTEIRQCFCGNHFEWSTWRGNKKYCSTKCCWRAAWRIRRHRV